MDNTAVEQLFRTMHLETEEQRVALRFEQLIAVENSLPVRVITTETTCQTITPERHEVA
jgi:hypothetical protein